MRVYNACLAEALRRSNATKSDPAYALAKALPRAKPGTPQSAARRSAFAAIEDRHGFGRYALQSYASSLRQSWVREANLSQEAQRLGRRAFDAVRRYHLGSGGRPRFRSASRSLHSLECADLNGSMRPVFGESGLLTGLRWGKDLVLATAQPKDAKQQAELERISELAKDHLLYCRIVRTVIASRITYRAQLVLDGDPPKRHRTGNEIVSLDLGPQVVDVVHESGAFTATLAEGIDEHGRELRLLLRKLDRQHRAGSPECFDEKGRHRPGRCAWRRHRSKNAERTISKIADCFRRTAEHRKSLHGRLWNEILAIGVNLRFEKLNYVAWQKNFPRSVQRRAPGGFIEIGRRKAESAGGTVYEFSPYTTALSSTCICGRRQKKPLSQRWHRCSCGTSAPRDRFSAFLGLYVHEVVDQATGEITDTLCVDEAALAYSGRHDIAGVPTQSTRAKHRVRRPCERSAERRRARLRRRRSSDRDARANLVHPAPTAKLLSAA